jgi:membrane fusion protein (multidrug efflux system)
LIQLKSEVNFHAQLAKPLAALKKGRRAAMRMIACMLLALLGISSPVNAQPAQQPAAIPVGVVTAERKPVTKTLDFVGRVDAVQRVEVKVRITGYLEGVLFKEGDLIKEGAPLYSIEKGLFEAAVEQAEGQLERSKAAKILTEVQLQRAEELLAKSSGTAVARDQAIAADQSAKGAILVDEANLRTARINLGYAEITSPIAGKIGKTSITKGNVVTPQSGPLTVIVSQDPMYVVFPVSQRDILRAQQAGHSVDITGIKAILRFADGSSYKHPGSINFVDVTVDRATDTVLARASFPNPDFALIDGQLVRVVLESGTPEQKIVIPQAALISDQEGVYVFIVEDGKAAIRRVKTGGASGTGIVVEQGLTGGEQVIVEGIQNLRRDVAVRATTLPPAPDRS